MLIDEKNIDEFIEYIYYLYDCDELDLYIQITYKGVEHELGEWIDLIEEGELR